jgi:hypothetical protein
MNNKKKDKQIEKLLFEVYEKGVKQQDCNLTDYIGKVKQALRIHDVVGRSEQLLAFKKWEAEKCRLPWDASPEQIVEQYTSQ